MANVSVQDARMFEKSSRAESFSKPSHLHIDSDCYDAIQDETVILRPIYQNRSSPQEYFSWRNDVWKNLFQSWRHKDTNATEIDNVRTRQNGAEKLMLMTHFCPLIAVHYT